MNSTRVLVLDHRDSFVFLLADQIARLQAEVRVVRSHMPLEVLTGLLADYRPDLVVLSPGPGHPEEGGVTMPWLRTAPTVPVLGVCLGHQAIGLAAGATVRRGPAPAHGIAAQLELAADPLFLGLPSRFPVARYHSLVVTDLPPCLQTLAVAREDGAELVMALRHRDRPQIGFQFHPESVLSPYGADLLQRVLAWARAAAPSLPHPVCREPS